ncbi:MAG: hypothetical protein WDN24_08955 [Sphingomonas sp.]
MAAPQIYETTLDRAGISIAVGSALGGGVVLALLLLGGEHDTLRLVWGWLIGAVFVAIGITAVVGPLWLVMHVAGLRRARHAALVGAGRGDGGDRRRADLGLRPARHAADRHAHAGDALDQRGRDEPGLGPARRGDRARSCGAWRTGAPSSA